MKGAVPITKERRYIMIDTILLDVGQVLAHFRWEEYLKDCGYSKEIQEKVARATVLSEYWGEQDRGILSEEELISKCSQIEPSVTAEIKSLFENIIKLVEEYDYSESFVRGLKDRGYKVYLLSNYGRVFNKQKEGFRFYPLVDGGVISYEVHTIKPEPEIYQCIIDKYNITPENAVFLDDNNNNLIAARRFGFHTIQVITHEQAVAELESLLG